MLDSPLAWVVNTICCASDTHWVVMDAGIARKVFGVVTQGRRDLDGYAPAAYTVQYSLDGSTYTDTNQGISYTGNVDRDTKKYNLFPQVVMARYIRISGTFWYVVCVCAMLWHGMICVCVFYFLCL